MKVYLRHRHLGVHKAVREIEIAGKFQDYLVQDNEDKTQRVLNEQKILSELPKDFLPRSPERILLMVSEGRLSTAISVPSFFRRWAKYFDAYTLDIIDEKDDESE